MRLAFGVLVVALAGCPTETTNLVPDAGLEPTFDAQFPTCTPAGEPCAGAGGCCSGVCGGGSTCVAAVMCQPGGETCTANEECCSTRCSEHNGMMLCQLLGGPCLGSGPVLDDTGSLNLFGELCADDGDCCSGQCAQDTNGVLRCKKLGDPRCTAMPQVLLADNELCQADCQCQTGHCRAVGGVTRCK